jgi:hypothetical protein
MKEYREIRGSQCRVVVSGAKQQNRWGVPHQQIYVDEKRTANAHNPAADPEATAA